MTAPRSATACAAPRRRRRGPAILVGALVTAGATLVGTSAFAAFDATSSVTSGSYTAATLTVSLGDTPSTTLFATGVANLVPGDYFYRYLDVQNTGSVGTTMVGVLSGTGTLVSSGTFNALVESCATAWTGGSSTCAGSTTVRSDAAVTTSASSVAYGSFAAGETKHLRVRFTLASSATNAVQGTTGTVTINATSTQLAPADRTNG